MDRRKKALILSSLFLISIFLLVTAIPPATLLVPATPSLSNNPTTIGIKADPTSEDYPYWWDTSYKTLARKPPT